jgi:magnesium transporter
MIVDYALYKDGLRYTEPSNLPELISKAKSEGGFVWLGLAAPTQEEFDKVAGDFDFHRLAIEDAIHANQRPKLEEYPGLQFCVIRTIAYYEPDSEVTTGEIHFFVGDHFIVVVRHGEELPLTDTRKQLENNVDLLSKGPYAFLYSIIDHAIDCYIDVAAELEQDVMRVENRVFNGKLETQSQDIYFLKREVIEFRHAIDPLLSPLQKLASEGAPHINSVLTPYFRDTLDHLSRASDAAAGLDSLLTSALQADLAHIQLQQNTDMRKITSYVALISVPTMVAGIYGMNFDVMPELRWQYGYPTVLGGLLLVTGFLYRKFKKANWL